MMTLASNAEFEADRIESLADPRLPPEVLKNYFTMQVGNCAAMAILHATTYFHRTHVKVANESEMEPMQCVVGLRLFQDLLALVPP